MNSRECVVGELDIFVFADRQRYVHQATWYVISVEIQVNTPLKVETRFSQVAVKLIIQNVDELGADCKCSRCCMADRATLHDKSSVG